MWNSRFGIGGRLMRRSARSLDANLFPLTLARGLRAAFADFASEPLPERLATLVRTLDEGLSEAERLGHQARWDAHLMARGDAELEPGLVAAISADMRGNTDGSADRGGAQGLVGRP